MSLFVDIKKRFGSFELNVSFQSEDEILALLGASGCGKSMTLKCIAGIITPDSGRIILNGRTLYDSERGINLAPQKRRVGYLFQQYALFPNMTVEQNIHTAILKKPKHEQAELIKKQIEAFKLHGLEKHRPHQLSGGQQQRVALARIFASEPELLLLDEPFSALDSYLKWQIELDMMETLKSFGKDVLFVSHNRDEVCRMCRSVCVLDNGRSEPKESVHELMTMPKTVTAALLSGCKNYSRIERIADKRFRAIDWGVELSCEQCITAESRYIGVRSHSLRLGTGTEENSIACKVVRVIDDVFSTIVMLQTPTGNAQSQLIRLEVQKDDWQKYSDKSDVSIYIEKKDVMVLNATSENINRQLWRN